MLRNLLICGLLAGLVRRPARHRVRARRRRGAGGSGDRVRAAAGDSRRASHEEAPVVSRAVQKSFGLVTAAVVYGLSLGGLFALAFAAVYGRVGPREPGAHEHLLAACAFVVVFLVPFVKYPANPPSVGDPDTITKRTARLPGDDPRSRCSPRSRRVRLRGVLAERWSGSAATLVACAAYLVVVVVSPACALPSIHEVPESVPGGDALPLPRGLDRHAARALDDHRARLRSDGAARHDRSADHPPAPAGCAGGRARTEQRERRAARRSCRAPPRTTRRRSPPTSAQVASGRA